LVIFGTLVTLLRLVHQLHFGIGIGSVFSTLGIIPVSFGTFVALWYT